MWTSGEKPWHGCFWECLDSRRRVRMLSGGRLVQYSTGWAGQGGEGRQRHRRGSTERTVLHASHIAHTPKIHMSGRRIRSNDWRKGSSGRHMPCSVVICRCISSGAGDDQCRSKDKERCTKLLLSAIHRRLVTKQGFMAATDASSFLVVIAFPVAISLTPNSSKRLREAAPPT
ncbi:hypothetical protein B296_00054394 [Ensete ventricosum]|uniref:Uncharacterized protein n=1 Tax=Ensete ventricosum TaxID=4639 RepID=A0A426X2Y7_ENSVE|nr:hypothetical protein B296_00054394 [Ensete ventricosum]